MQPPLGCTQSCSWRSARAAVRRSSIRSWCTAAPRTRHVGAPGDLDRAYSLLPAKVHGPPVESGARQGGNHHGAAALAPICAEWLAVDGQNGWVGGEEVAGPSAPALGICIAPSGDLLVACSVTKASRIPGMARVRIMCGECMPRTGHSHAANRYLLAT